MWYIFLTQFFLILSSRASPGHDELRRVEGTAHPHHVEPTWSKPSQIRSRQRLHQELGQNHRQQSHVRHLLRFRQHPQLQGCTGKSFSKVKRKIKVQRSLVIHSIKRLPTTLKVKILYLSFWVKRRPVKIVHWTKTFCKSFIYYSKRLWYYRYAL